MINLGTINQKPVLQIFTHYFEPSHNLAHEIIKGLRGLAWRHFSLNFEW